MPHSVSNLLDISKAFVVGLKNLNNRTVFLYKKMCQVKGVDWMLKRWLQLWLGINNSYDVQDIFNAYKTDTVF